jgi:hypothetical protein
MGKLYIETAKRRKGLLFHVLTFLLMCYRNYQAKDQAKVFMKSYLIALQLKFRIIITGFVSVGWSWYRWSCQCPGPYPWRSPGLWTFLVHLCDDLSRRQRVESMAYFSCQKNKICKNVIAWLLKKVMYKYQINLYRGDYTSESSQRVMFFLLYGQLIKS